MHISNLRGKLAKAHAVYIHTVGEGLDLIKWLLLLVVIFMGSFIFFLQREIKRLTKKIATLLNDKNMVVVFQSNFEKKNLMDLVDALNTWLDENEQKDKHFKKWKKTSDYRSSAFSHDLRTPLTAINGYVQLLNR